MEVGLSPSPTQSRKILPPLSEKKEDATGDASLKYVELKESEERKPPRVKSSFSPKKSRSRFYESVGNPKHSSLRHVKTVGQSELKKEILVSGLDGRRILNVDLDGDDEHVIEQLHQQHEKRKRELEMEWKLDKYWDWQKDLAPHRKTREQALLDALDTMMVYQENEEREAWTRTSKPSNTSLQKNKSLVSLADQNYYSDSDSDMKHSQKIKGSKYRVLPEESVQESSMKQSRVTRFSLPDSSVDHVDRTNINLLEDRKVGNSSGSTHIQCIKSAHLNTLRSSTQYQDMPFQDTLIGDDGNEGDNEAEGQNRAAMLWKKAAQHIKVRIHTAHVMKSIAADAATNRITKNFIADTYMEQKIVLSRKYLNNMVCVFSFLALFVAVILNELEYYAGFWQYMPLIIRYSKFLVSVFSLLLIYYLYQYYLAKVQHKKHLNILRVDAKLWLMNSIRNKFILETIILGYHIPPFLEFDHIFILPMLFRLYLIGRMIKYHGNFMSKKVQLVSRLNHVRFSTAFTLKTILKRKPTQSVIAAFLLIIFVSSYALTICERPEESYFFVDNENTSTNGTAFYQSGISFEEGQISFDFAKRVLRSRLRPNSGSNPLNSTNTEPNHIGLWVYWILGNLISIDNSIIGPSTKCGRAVATISSALGIIITSILIAVVSTSLELNQGESKVVEHYRDDMMNNQLRDAAVRSIQRIWRIKTKRATAQKRIDEYETTKKRYVPRSFARMSNKFRRKWIKLRQMRESSQIHSTLRKLKLLRRSMKNREGSEDMLFKVSLDLNVLQESVDAQTLLWGKLEEALEIIACRIEDIEDKLLQWDEMDSEEQIKAPHTSRSSRLSVSSQLPSPNEQVAELVQNANRTNPLSYRRNSSDKSSQSQNSSKRKTSTAFIPRRNSRDMFVQGTKMSVFQTKSPLLSSEDND